MQSREESSKRSKDIRIYRILSPFSAWTNWPRKTRKTVARAHKIQRFFSQPFHVAEVFTGRPGRYVELADTIKGFKGILEGKYDHLPEQAFFMAGPIEEVEENAKKLKA